LKNFYIAIEGGIGVGKTTLARLLQPLFQAELLLEQFEENPFLANFYSDRARYAFQTQIFFLLSRYRQQSRAAPSALAHSSLVSDYTFAKDKLFADLNLGGDELEMYQRVYAILDKNIPRPDLVVYLRADTDVLLKRIAHRDRSYERDMDRDYIDQLRQAYESFFAAYQDTPLLTLDSNSIDFVRNPDDLTYVTGQVRSALGLLPRQASLLPRQLTATPALEEASQAVFEQERRRLADLQRWHLALDEEKGFERDINFNYICLTQEIGELGAVLARAWKTKSANQAALGEELADCLAYLLKLANYAGIDLEQAYLQKMQINKNREWRL
jgi:deoxyadenosine/deoxycytidine kinase/NTP pyrophosphatase (non-canonical NTP hydrolase)